MSFRLMPWERQNRKIVSIPHFWAIVVIIITLFIIYYSNFLFPDRHWNWFWHLEVFEFNYRVNGILFYIPIIYAIFIFWWRGAMITWALSIAILAYRILYFGVNASSIVVNMIYLFFPLMVVLYISLELKWRAKERSALIEREAERQAYMSQIFKAQEDERHRLSLELHDDTTQTLLVIATRAQTLSSYENVKTMPQSKAEAEWIKDTAISVSEALRRLSLELRPGILDNLGLIPALRWLISNLSQDGIKAAFEVKGTKRVFTSETDINIFRIVQEALNNIRRHSQATEALVVIEFTPEKVNFVIQDNGIGFSLPKTTSKLTAMGKLGLTGMQQRVKFLNGTFNMVSAPGKGTKISIELMDYSRLQHE